MMGVTRSRSLYDSTVGDDWDSRAKNFRDRGKWIQPGIGTVLACGVAHLNPGVTMFKTSRADTTASSYAAFTSRGTRCYGRYGVPEAYANAPCCAGVRECSGPAGGVLLGFIVVCLVVADDTDIYISLWDSYKL